MAARPLYELAAGFNALFDLVLDEAMDLQLLEEGLHSIECELEEKCAGGIALIKSLEAYAEAYSKEQKRFEAQQTHQGVVPAESRCDGENQSSHPVRCDERPEKRRQTAPQD